jgi:hypothetical protein
VKMREIQTFDEYLASLGRLRAHVDPTAAAPEQAQVKEATDSLATLPQIDAPTLTTWVRPTRLG